MYVKPYSSNQPLWSLTNEFWYYMLFPCLWLGVAARGPLRRRWVHLAVAAIIVVILTRFVLVYFTIWLLGAALAVAPRWSVLTGRGGKVAGGLAAIAVVAALGLCYSQRLVAAFRYSEIVADLVLGLAIAGAMYVALHATRPSYDSLYARTSKRLANISYTLYLTHMPPLVFAAAWLTTDRNWSPASPARWLGAAAMAAVVVAYAWLVAQVTEARTESVRRRLSAWLLPPAR